MYFIKLILVIDENVKHVISKKDKKIIEKDFTSYFENV